MKVSEIYDIINDYAPYDSQEGFDNSGLNVGDPDDEVNAVLTCVDVSKDVINEAINEGCNLIISHHPIIFRPLPNLLSSDYVGSLAIYAAKNDVNLLSAHTNMDKADGGINDRLAEFLGGRNLRKIPEVDEYATFFDFDAQTMEELTDTISATLRDDRVSSIGSGIVATAAVVGGAGGDYSLIDYCIKEGIVLITSELKHHLARMIDDRQGKIITVGHFTSERIFVNIISDILTDKVAVKESTQISPFNSIYGKEQL